VRRGGRRKRGERREDGIEKGVKGVGVEERGGGDVGRRRKKEKGRGKWEEGRG